MSKQELKILHPEDKTEMKYWINKWGVSTRTIYDAILETGSLNPAVLRTYLKSQGYMKYPALNYFHLLKNIFKNARHKPEKKGLYRIA